MRLVIMVRISRFGKEVDVLCCVVVIWSDVAWKMTALH